MLRIRHNTALEAALDRAARLRLREWRKTDPGFRQWLSVRLKLRPSGMPRAEFLRFQILHRQFGGRGVPGLSHLVQAGRRVWRGAKVITQATRGELP